MKSKQTYFQWQKEKKFYWIINLFLGLILMNLLPSNLKWISPVFISLCMIKILSDYVRYLQVQDIPVEIETRGKKIARISLNVTIVLIFAFVSVEFFMTKFGSKKYYEVVEGNVTIKDSLTEGIIAYKSSAPGMTFFKWNITSIKEIKHKSDTVK